MVRATIDARVQTIVNDSLEHGLSLYEKRHPRGQGQIQGSVVVLRNADAAILAETGGRQTYRDRANRYSDYNRVTGSLRQPGSTMKPLVYLAAFESGLALDSTVPDEPIEVPLGDGGVKWIANYDNQFKGPIPVRQALAESRNAVAVWITREIGVSAVIRTARQMGIRSPAATLPVNGPRGVGGAVAGTGGRLSSHRLRPPRGTVRRRSRRRTRPVTPSTWRRGRPQAIASAALHEIQEGLRGVVRLPGGTAYSLSAGDFPVPVMGKTGTTSDFRDALFVGSTYGVKGITVAVRIGFDDNRPLGVRETGGLHGAARVPRNHAPRLQGATGRAGAALPPRHRIRD